MRKNTAFPVFDEKLSKKKKNQKYPQAHAPIIIFVKKKNYCRKRQKNKCKSLKSIFFSILQVTHYCDEQTSTYHSTLFTRVKNPTPF